jgi:hypothetical protein
MSLQTFLLPGSIVVEHSTHYPKIEGTNLCHWHLQRKFAKQCEQCHRIGHFTSFTKNRCGCAPAAEHLNINPKMEGLNPATGIGREKMAKNLLDNVTLYNK